MGGGRTQKREYISSPGRINADPSWFIKSILLDDFLKNESKLNTSVLLYSVFHFREEIEEGVAIFMETLRKFMVSKFHREAPNTYFNQQKLIVIFLPKLFPKDHSGGRQRGEERTLKI